MDLEGTRSSPKPPRLQPPPRGWRGGGGAGGRFFARGAPERAYTGALAPRPEVMGPRDRAMKQIDKLVGHLMRFQAESLVAVSNAPVVVRVAGSERTSNQTIDHGSVMAMVQEVAALQSLQELRAG